MVQTSFATTLFPVTNIHLTGLGGRPLPNNRISRLIQSVVASENRFPDTANQNGNLRANQLNHSTDLCHQRDKLETKKGSFGHSLAIRLTFDSTPIGLDSAKDAISRCSANKFSARFGLGVWNLWQTSFNVVSSLSQVFYLN